MKGADHRGQSMNLGINHGHEEPKGLKLVKLFRDEPQGPRLPLRNLLLP
jgi:hypothetical protein